MDASHRHAGVTSARWALLGVAAAACGMQGASAAVEPAGSGQRQFAVFLGERRIGTHRFEFSGPSPGDTTTVTSTASFTVKILGIPAYRYRHLASEGWRDGCLESLVASTDDNGHRLRVDAHREGAVLRVRAQGAVQALRGCVMSYAYWDRRLVAQDRLLNPQTGVYDAVHSQLLGSERLQLPAGPVAADRYLLSAAGLHIDLWYSPAGEWLQLDSTTPDGRRLRYRLE